MNTRCSAPILAGLLALGALDLLGPASGMAATQTVTTLADDGSAGTLRARIAAAAAGDTVAFTPSGTITLALGELVVDKNLTINGAGITLDAAGASRVLRLTAGNTLQISGTSAQPVHVTGGVASSGGGIDSTGTLTVLNAVISGNTATIGGGIFSEQGAGPTTLTGVTVEDNGARDGAGLANGTFAGGGSTMSLTDCIVRNNVASGGGPFADNEGGGILNLATLVVTTSQITSNTAGVGGGIYSATPLAGTALSLVTTDVTDNTAKLAGGIFLLGTGEITAQSTVSGNFVTGGLPFNSGDGGGVLNYGDLAIGDSEVSDNTAQRGGGIFSIGTLDLQDAAILRNIATDGFQTTAANRGGGIFSSGELTVSGISAIDDNDAGFGGGLFTEGLASSATLDGATISDNTAVSGGGIGNGDSQAGGGTIVLTDCEIVGNLATGGEIGSSDANSGGGILNFGRLSMTEGRLTGNRGGTGGGILNERSQDRVCALASNVCLSEADCTGGTGPCKARGDVMLTDVTIENNRAGLGGGVVNRSGMSIEGSTLVRNRADFGGAIYNDGQGLLALVNSTVSDNVAGTSVSIDEATQERTLVLDPDGGASVYNNSGMMDVLNCTFHGGSMVARGGLFLIGNSVLDDSPCGTNTLLVSQGYNLETGNTCGLAGSGDAVNGIAGLDALAANGGTTMTHALGSASQAWNTGHPSEPGSAGACAADDQRGIARTSLTTGRCDKGSFESACGNSVIDAPEACDDGDTEDGDGCDHNCTLTACGNGVITAPEVCDDGNLDADDYCAGLQCIAGDNLGTACTQDDDCDRAAIAGSCSSNTCVQGNVGSFCIVDANCDVAAVAGVCEGCGEVTHECGDGSVEASIETCDDGDDDNTDDCLDTCRSAECGDGYIHDGVEACDDANLQTGDGCTSTCTLEYCGDGVVNNGDEACDDGNADNNDGCRNDCHLSSCGDGVPDLGEDCDDDNNTGGDGCSPTCLIEECGNGILDLPESCDDDNVVDNDGCDSNCTVTDCGNGVTTGVEVCDDGNVSSDDYCNADCSAATGSCGDTIVQAGVEGCDDGAAANGDGCNALCQLESCGDGLLNNGPPLGAGEACDDANTVTGDYCAADCSAVTGSCGDGLIQSNEECDDFGEVGGDGCDSSCDLESCGDGIVNNVGEVCDDGNNLSHDYCAADCSAVTGTCGDGVVQSRLETCDDSSQCADLTTDCTVAGAAACVGIGDETCAARDGDGCDSNCIETGCGNGIMTGLEACDDGNIDSRDYCSPACEATGSCGDSLVQSGVEHCDAGAVQTQTCEVDCTRAVCGDGIMNSLAGEVCDDGRHCTDGTPCTGDASVCSGIGDGTCRTRGDDYCRADCRALTGSCGDGIIQKGVEECDDSLVQSAACEINCQLPRCGDSVLNPVRGEVCDDGNEASDDSCTGTCQDAVCGDGFVWVGTEECDDSGESIACDTDCTMAICSDSTLNPTAGENCDDGNTTDDDGCSSTCGGEGIQNDAQQACIVRMNAAVLKLASAQAREDFDCVKKGLKGVFDTIDAQVCLTRDDRGKVQAASDAVVAAETEHCTENPGFGYSGSTTAIAAAIDQNIGLMADLMGPDLNDSIITKTASLEAHNCQATITRNSNLLLLSRMRAFVQCKRTELADETLDSAADLATVCFAQVAADTRRLETNLERLAGSRVKRCEGVDLAEAFPGSCAGQTDGAFDSCVDRHAACRMCLLVNTADRLSQPCDLFDDSVANGSCG